MDNRQQAQSKLLSPTELRLEFDRRVKESFAFLEANVDPPDRGASAYQLCIEGVISDMVREGLILEEQRAVVRRLRY